jgi:hypothetical protein
MEKIMKIIPTAILSAIMALSSMMVVAETEEVDHAAHHATEAAKQVDKPATMPMHHDMADMKKMGMDKMDMKNMSPEQCKKMMQAHHADMKMDAQMMDGMKHCEMMKGSK